MALAVFVVGTLTLTGFIAWTTHRSAKMMTAAISILLAGLFLWRGSLLPPLVAHYAVNLLQLLVAYRHRDRLFGA